MLSDLTKGICDLYSKFLQRDFDWILWPFGLSNTLAKGYTATPSDFFSRVHFPGSEF